MALNFVHQMDALKEQDINNIKGTKKRLVLMGYQEDADSPASTSSFVVDLPELANIIHATGPQGITGIQGLQGIAGKDGSNGTVSQSAIANVVLTELSRLTLTKNDTTKLVSLKYGAHTIGSFTDEVGTAGDGGVSSTEVTKIINEWMKDSSNAQTVYNLIKSLLESNFAKGTIPTADQLGATFMKKDGSNSSTSVHFSQGTVVQSAAFYEDGSNPASTPSAS